MSGRLDERKVFQNYKQLQFIDTLALYFNRIHPSERGEQVFENVPISRDEDTAITVRPAGDRGLIAFPVSVRHRWRASSLSEGAASCRVLATARADGEAALKQAPSEWESFHLVAA